MKAWEIWKLDYFAVILMWFFWSATYCYTFSISFFFLGILTWVLRVPFTLSNYLFIAWKSNILIGERMKSFRRWKRLGLWLNYLFIKKNKIIITICWTGALIGTKEPQFVWFRHWFVKIEFAKIEIFNRIQNWYNASVWLMKVSQKNKKNSWIVPNIWHGIRRCASPDANPICI